MLKQVAAKRLALNNVLHARPDFGVFYEVENCWFRLSVIPVYAARLTDMNSNRLQTQRLELVLPTAEEALAGIDAMSPAEKEHLSDDWLELVKNATSSDPWIHGFSITFRDDDVVVGQCGFKGPPSSDGIVEIAYAVHPDHQCRGYATEAAEALVAYAFTNGDVSAVRAHTLPETNASTRVLTKCGFQHVGEVMDPDDGLVWRWQKNDGSA